MNEVDFKIELEKIQKDLASINKKTPGLGGAFLKGIMTGLGSIVGVALALVILGYVLNVLGVIPALRNETNSWKQTLENIKGYK